MSKTKEDYYNTPNSELGNNDDTIVESDIVVDDKDTVSETPPPAAKGDLSAEELEKIKSAQTPTATPPAKVEDKKKDDVPAVEYEIEVDDNSPLTDEDVSDVVKMAEAKGMTKEEAQAEIARRESFLKRGETASEYRANKQLEAYEKEVSAHPLFATNEIKKESMRSVDEALNRFFDPSFKERFELYYKRDVHLLTALHRLGKPFVADTMEGHPTGAISAELNSEAAQEESRLKRLYPDQFAKN